MSNLQDPNKVSVISPEGKFGTIDLTDWTDAESKGYKLASDQEIAGVVERQKYDTLGNETLAGLAGAARGLSLGLSDLALTSSDLVDPETLRKFRQYSPTASIGGEVAGAILPIALSTLATAPAGGSGGVAAGAGVAARLGARAAPSALLSRGVLRAETEMASRLAKGVAGVSSIIPEGASLGTKVLAKAMKAAPKVATQAAEGAIYGAGTALTEDVLGEVDHNAESLLSTIGTGALFGLAVPVALGTTGAVASYSGKKAADAVRKVAGSIDELISKDIAPLVRGTGSVAFDDTIRHQAKSSLLGMAIHPAVSTALPGAGTVATVATSMGLGQAAEAALHHPAVKKVVGKVAIDPATSLIGAGVKGLSALKAGLPYSTVEKGVGQAFKKEGKEIRKFIHQTGADWDKFTRETSDSLLESIDETRKLSASLDGKFDEIYGEVPVAYQTEIAGQPGAFVTEDVSVFSNALAETMDALDSSVDDIIVPKVQKDLHSLTASYLDELFNAEIHPEAYYQGFKKLPGVKEAGRIRPDELPFLADAPIYPGFSRVLGAKQAFSPGKKVAAGIGREGVRAGTKAAEKMVGSVRPSGPLSVLDLVGITPQAKKQVRKWIRETGRSVEEYIDVLAKGNPSINQKYIKKLHKTVRKAEADLTKTHGFSSTTTPTTNPKLQWMKDNPVEWKTAKRDKKIARAIKREELFHSSIDAPREGKWASDDFLRDTLGDKHLTQQFFNQDTKIPVAPHISVDDPNALDFLTKAGGPDGVVVKHKRGANGTIPGEKGMPSVIMSWADATKEQRKHVRENSSSWYFERKLDLVDEFRVIVIGDKPVLVKHRWGKSGVKKTTDFFGLPPLQNMQNVSDDALRLRLEKLAAEASAETPLLSTGMDIGLTKDGELFLIELQPNYGVQTPGMEKAYNSLLGETQFASNPEARTVESLRGTLSEEKYFGEVGKGWGNIAVAQRNFKEAELAVLDSFGKLDDPFGAPTISPEKVKGWLTSVGTDKSKATRRQTEAMKDYLEKSQALIEISNHVDKSKAMQTAGNFKKYVDSLDNVKAKNELDAFRVKNPLMHELGFLSVAHALFGGIFVTPLTAAARAYANPALASKALFHVESTLTKMNERIERGVLGALLPKSREARRKAGKRSALLTPLSPATTLLGLSWSSKKSDRKEAVEIYEEKIEEITELLTDDKFLERINNSTEGLSVFAPKTALAFKEKGIKSLHYLMEKAPVNPYLGTPEEDNWKPSPSAIARWASIARVVENPMTIIEDISNGNFPSPEATQALVDNYPQLYSKITAQLYSEMDKVKKLPYQQQLSVLNFMGQSPAPIGQNPSGGTASPTSTSHRKMKVDIADDSETELDRIGSK